jgi:hypothetical protein
MHPDGLSFLLSADDEVCLVQSNDNGSEVTRWWTESLVKFDEVWMVYLRRLSSYNWSRSFSVVCKFVLSLVAWHVFGFHLCKQYGSLCWSTTLPAANRNWYFLRGQHIYVPSFSKWFLQRVSRLREVVRWLYRMFGDSVSVLQNAEVIPSPKYHIKTCPIVSV